MSFNIHISTFVVNDKKQILLIKETDNKNFAKHSLPEGVLKQNEPLFECGKRILKETLGLTAGIDSLMGMYVEHGEVDTNMYLIFFVSYLYGQINPGNKSGSGYHWADEKEFLLMADYELANPKRMRKALNDYRRGLKIPLEVIGESIKSETK